MLLTASSDIKFHAWPINSDLDKVYRPPEASKVICLSLSSDDRYLTYVTDAGRADIISHKERDDIKFVHAISAIGEVTCAAFQRTTKKNLALGTKLAHLALYDTRSKAITKLYNNVPACIKYLEFNSNDGLLGVACQNGSAVIFDNTNGPENGKIKGSYVMSRTCIPTALRFHPTQPSILATATDEGSAMVWDVNSARKLFFSQNHSASVTGLSWAETSDLLITVGSDSKICIHDLTVKECVFRSNLQRSLTAVDVSPDGITLAIGAEDGVVHTYDLRNLLQPIAIFQAHPSPITKVMFEHKMSESVPIEEPGEECVINCVGEDKEIRKDVFSVYKPKSAINKLIKDNVFIVESFPSRITPKTGTTEEGFSIAAFKESILGSVQRETDHVRNQMICHMNHLQAFIHSEFKKMETQMDDKWEVLDIASCVAKSNVEESLYDDSRSRTDVSDYNEGVPMR